MTIVIVSAAYHTMPFYAILTVMDQIEDFHVEADVVRSSAVSNKGLILDGTSLWQPVATARQVRLWREQGF